jgi:lactate dehydrogenase-like 2-hydroxyacid dehydrogenase
MGMARLRVLVTRRIFPEAVAFLRERAEVEYVESDDPLPPEELIARSRGKQGIVSQLTDKFGAGEIARLEGVRVISDVAVGYDNVDVEAATRHGILVTNTPDVLTWLSLCCWPRRGGSSRVTTSSIRASGGAGPSIF